MEPLGNDRWRGALPGRAARRATATRVRGWVDRFGSWRARPREARRGRAGRRASTLEIGAQPRRGRRRERRRPDAAQRSRPDRAGRAATPSAERRAALDDARSPTLVRRHADRAPRRAHRPRARRCGSTARARASRPGTSCSRARRGRRRRATARFATSIDRLPYVAELGFDVLYLPPIHPIGATHRKGPNNTPTAEPDDVGSPWAIGARRGRPHRDPPRARHARRLRPPRRARRSERGLEVALDIAFQCSPDHPWVTEHPEWFRHRPDGTIQYAENPPKKYQDIYPFDFESRRLARRCGTRCATSFAFWIDARRARSSASTTRTPSRSRSGSGDRARCRREHPDVDLPRRGVHPARGDGAPGQGRLHPVVHVLHLAQRRSGSSTSTSTELTHDDGREYFRPELLAEHARHPARAAAARRPRRRSSPRLVLAATLSPNYGIYGPAFELRRARAVRAGQRGVPRLREVPAAPLGPRRARTACATLIARVNADPPRATRRCSTTATLRFHDDRQRRSCSATRRRDRDGDDVVLVRRQPRPASHASRAGSTLDLADARPRRDERRTRSTTCSSGATLSRGTGARNFVELDPDASPAHIFARRRRRDAQSSTTSSTAHERRR